MKILSVGMMVCDTVIGPVPNDILSIDSVEIDPPVQSCGGDALNTAIGASRLSCDVTMCGKVGDDLWGRFLLDECKKNGVDISGVKTDCTAPTPCSFVLLDSTGERHFLSHREMFEKISYDDISEALIRDADIVYVGSLLSMKQMDDGGIERLFKKAHEHGAVTVMDAAINENENQNWEECLPAIFKETDVFFPSLLEASAIAKSSNLQEITAYFSTYRMKFLGVKLGGKGCFVTDYQTERFIDCPHMFPVVDTTGAGDSFMAGFLCAMTHGSDFFRCAEFASLIGSLNVSKRGSVGGVPSYEEAVRQFYIWKKGING